MPKRRTIFYTLKIIIMDLNNNELAPSVAPEKKKKNKFCVALNTSEKIVHEIETGYLFHSGDGNVKYRAFSDVERYQEENEHHAREVKNIPPRHQSSSR